MVKKKEEAKKVEKSSNVADTSTDEFRLNFEVK